jgi:hypothetical protein
MMVRTMIPVDGIVTTCQRPTGAPNPLERLIRIVRQNDELLERLQVQGRRLARARSYADDPESSPALGTALVDHARRGYVHLLGILRANRAEALGLLRACGHADAS